MLATRALRRVGTARAFSTTTSTTARAAAAAALAASGARRRAGRPWAPARAGATHEGARGGDDGALRAPRAGGAAAPAPRAPRAAARPRRAAPRRLAGSRRGGALPRRSRSARGAPRRSRSRSARARRYAGQLAARGARTAGRPWAAAVYGTTLAGLTAAVDVGLLGGGRARRGGGEAVGARGARRAARARRRPPLVADGGRLRRRVGAGEVHGDPAARRDARADAARRRDAVRRAAGGSGRRILTLTLCYKQQHSLGARHEVVQRRRDVALP